MQQMKKQTQQSNKQCTNAHYIFGWYWHEKSGLCFLVSGTQSRIFNHKNGHFWQKGPFSSVQKCSEMQWAPQWTCSATVVRAGGLQKRKFSRLLGEFIPEPMPRANGLTNLTTTAKHIWLYGYIWIWLDIYGWWLIWVIWVWRHERGKV